MRYARMPIEVESPEEFGYSNIRFNLSESSIADQTIAGLGLSIPDLTLLYTEHRGSRRLRELILGDAADLGPDDVLVTGGGGGRAVHHIDRFARPWRPSRRDAA